MGICSIPNPPVEKALMLEIENLLRSMGASGCQVGLRFAVYSVAILLKEPDRIHYIVKGIYMEVADQLNVKPSSVERGIRTMVLSLWKQPDHSKLDEVFGHHLFRRPTNSEFLESIAYYIRSNS